MIEEPNPQQDKSEASAVLPVVAIVGRPNVGKSALFNRIVGSRHAIVEDVPGTTRDRIYSEVEWRARRFLVVDTGGLEPEAAAGYAALVKSQVQTAVREAAVVLFLVDSRDGVTAGDLDVADVLRRSKKPVFLLANKAENIERREAVVEFYELGFGEPMPVSAFHGTGVADVLDMVVDSLPERGEPLEEAEERPLGVAIVGRPNVGKSTLLNAIIGEERVIVSEEPGTTRDAIDMPFEFEGRRLVLVDTAGLRRRGHIEPGVEKHAALRVKRALERADIALVVFDASDGLTAQDLHVVGYALESYAGIVLVANKWDLLEDVPREDFERRMRRRSRFAPWAELCVISAKENSGIEPVLKAALRIGEERKRRIETGQLNAVVRRLLGEKPPPAVHGKDLKLLYVTQAQISPPTFVFFVNDASIVHFSFRRRLENMLREAFGFKGTALKLVFRGREEK